MKYTFTTKDPIEAKRLAKALDMAIVIHEFTRNTMRGFKHRAEEPTADEVMAAFYDLLENMHIDIDDILE